MQFYRILVSCIPQLETHRKDADIQWHVLHEKQTEMSRKSVVVSTQLSILLYTLYTIM